MSQVLCDIVCADMTQSLAETLMADAPNERFVRRVHHDCKVVVVVTVARVMSWVVHQDASVGCVV